MNISSKQKLKLQKEFVRFPNGVVVSAKIIKEYVKKLKSTPVEFTLSDTALEISFHTREAKGRLVLTDMSKDFIGLDLPVKEVGEDGQISFT